jgi:hypothetical protein
MAFLAIELPRTTRRIRTPELLRLLLERTGQGVEPLDPMAAALPGEDYEASCFENSSEKENIFPKNICSDRGATRRPPIGGKRHPEPL